MQKEENMDQPQMKKITINGIEMAYWVYGEGKPPIVGVHGLAANAREFDCWAHELASYYQVICPDLRAHGQSSKPGGTCDLHVLADDMVEFINKMGLKDVLWIGQSLGAYIGMIIAAEKPGIIKKLIMGDAGASTPAEYREAAKERLKPVLSKLTQIYPSKEAYIDFKRMAIPKFKESWNEYAENFTLSELAPRPDGSFGHVSVDATDAIWQIVNDLADTDFDVLYPKVTCRTLIVRATGGFYGPGTGDALPRESAIAMLKAMPSAELFEVDGLSHVDIFFYDQPAMMKKIVEFLKS